MPDVVLFFTFENRPPVSSVVLLLRLQEHFVDYDNYNRLSNEEKEPQKDTSGPFLSECPCSARPACPAASSSSVPAAGG